MTLKGPEEYLQRGLWAVLQQICKIWPQKSRSNTLPTKAHIVKAMVFPVDTYGCESWTIRRLSAEELMLSNCGMGGLLRVP